MISAELPSLLKISASSVPYRTTFRPHETVVVQICHVTNLVDMELYFINNHIIWKFFIKLNFLPSMINLFVHYHPPNDVNNNKIAAIRT